MTTTKMVERNVGKISESLEIEAMKNKSRKQKWLQKNKLEDKHPEHDLGSLVMNHF